ncbi:unnamed protein product [Ambrosiozyma monospora]|uniref:Unnamed protein product n=1 Tax=Ambrosiozyma monospora TaxID=43982 RepID=A0A9W6Z6B8_AMBMO|nr:unnamed protein product [Ambrosiozyma monospora]
MAKDLMRFLLGGIVTHEKFGYQGLKWHYSKKYMSSISNCVSATCAMKLIPYAQSDAEKKQLYDFARVCLDFIWNHMFDESDGLIWDGIGKDSDVIDKNKYTYNTGNTLTAMCLMYKYDGNPEWEKKCKTLAEAATHRGKTMFDRDYDDYGKRYWHDPSYFIQLLVEGIADYLETFDQKIPESTRNCCKEEIARHLSYFRKYCFDPQDNMYYSSFDIYRINPQIYQRYQMEFGGHKKFQPCEDDRVQGSCSIQERQCCKSLIGEASAARIFFQGARVFPKMDPRSC